MGSPQLGFTGVLDGIAIGTWEWQRGWIMKAFLVTVLSVIAVGVLLIAYGLLVPRDVMADGYRYARPTLASQQVGYIDDGYANPYGGTVRQPLPYAVNDVRAVPASYQTYVAPAAPRRVTATRAVRSTPVRYVERSGRDWKKTAMVIGGTTAAGAGLGAIFGGKKGALIGAALGGGAGTLYEVKKR